MKIRIKKVHPQAVLPAYAYASSEDAGLDLCAVDEITLAPGGAKAVATGLAIEIPKGYDIKPMSEMGGPGGGGRIFRMGEN